ncbi:MAG: hypothetical protein LBO21_03765 [Synergistaceae bacterium]|jgi:hypothetical protein|nr:hypothetical protein [Synergistaceae bacterium]
MTKKKIVKSPNRLESILQRFSVTAVSQTGRLFALGQSPCGYYMIYEIGPDGKRSTPLPGLWLETESIGELLERFHSWAAEREYEVHVGRPKAGSRGSAPPLKNPAGEPVPRTPF